MSTPGDFTPQPPVIFGVDPPKPGEPGDPTVMAMLAQLGENVVPTVQQVMHDEVVVVAFQVLAGSQMHAQQFVERELKQIRLTDQPGEPGIYARWYAMDERYDGSDEDSAVFVPKGIQAIFQGLVDQIKDAAVEQDSSGSTEE